MEIAKHEKSVTRKNCNMKRMQNEERVTRKKVKHEKSAAWTKHKK